MKNWKILTGVLALTVFLGGTTALMQQSKGLLSEKTDQQKNQEQNDAVQQKVMSNGTRHKLTLITTDPGDMDVYAELKEEHAILKDIDYGSFRVVIVDENILPNRRESLSTLRVQLSDDQNLIPLNGYMLDTTDREATYSQLPPELPLGDMHEALTSGSNPQGGLYLVQFIGPIKDEWLKALRASGVKIITYMPNNAYVVQGDATTATNLISFKNYPFVQFIGDYASAFRISPELQSMRQLKSSEQVDITVQIVDGLHALSVMSALRSLATEFVQEHRVLTYRNVELKVPVANIGLIASNDDVFGIERRTPRTRRDEAQGQIVAGNLSGTSPTGPGYLNFLASKGFASAQFGSFAVNV
ncbi:MAG: hypothetical protein ACRD4L_09110, partial [Pyrinomonadaceae bacterium]